MGVFQGPLFIVGAPRSGTKLLRDLVKQHPAIGIPDYETEFLPRWLDKGLDDDWYAWATRFMYFKYMDDEGRLVSESAWKDASPSHDIAGLFEGLCRHDAQQPDGVWGDKSPNYRNHLPQLKALYPQARFVHIVRDGRDVALSSHKAWRKHILRNAQRWQSEVSACREAGAAMGSDYLELRYEDLLDDPTRWLTAIAEHVGQGFSEAMLDPGRATENLGDTKGATGIVQGNTGKWRERMPKEQLRRVEQLCGPLLSQLGYERAFPFEDHRPATRREMHTWRLVDGANLLKFRVEEWGWRDAVKYSVSALESTLVR